MTRLLNEIYGEGGWALGEVVDVRWALSFLAEGLASASDLVVTVLVTSCDQFVIIAWKVAILRIGSRFFLFLGCFGCLVNWLTYLITCLLLGRGNCLRAVTFLVTSCEQFVIIAVDGMLIYVLGSLWI